MQSVIRGFLGRRRVGHKRRFIAENQEAAAAAGTITRALRQATAHRRYKKRKAAETSEADKAARLKREEEERLAALARIKTYADASAQTDPVIIVPLVTPKSAAQVPADYQAALNELTQRGTVRASTLRQTQSVSSVGIITGNVHGSTARLRDPFAELGNREESVQLPAVATYRPSHTGTLTNRNSSALSLASSHSGSSGSQGSRRASNPVAAFVAGEPLSARGSLDSARHERRSLDSARHERRRSSGVLEVLTEMRRASGSTEGEEVSLCSQVTHTGATNSPTSVGSGMHAQIPEDEEGEGGAIEDVAEAAVEHEQQREEEEVDETPTTASFAHAPEHVPSEEREERRQEGSHVEDEEEDSSLYSGGRR